MRVGPGVVLSLLLLVPDVDAQGNAIPPPTIEFEDQMATDAGPDGRVAPGTETATGSVTIRVGCSLADASGDPTNLEFDLIESDPYAIVSLSPRQTVAAFTAPECADRTYMESFAFNVTLSFTREAPAFADSMVRVAVTVHKPEVPGQNTTYGPFEMEGAFRPDFLADVAYAPSATVLKTGVNKQVAFPVRMQNLGNGQARIQTTITSSPDGITVTPPPEVRLDSKVSSGAAAKDTEIVAIMALTRASGTHCFDVLFTASSVVPGPEINQTVPMTLCIKVTGGPLAGPGVPSFALFALVALALLRRSRKG